MRSLLVVYGVALIGSGIFAPDASGGFPAGMDETVTVSGLLHLAFGAIGFISLGVAAIGLSGWPRLPGGRRARSLSLLAGVLVIVGFAVGGALSRVPVGVLLLWIAVVVGFAWLLIASVGTYSTVPHPDVARR